MAGAIEVVMVPIPIITPRRSSGDFVKMMSNISGNAIPVPIPWKTRPASSTNRLGAKPSKMTPAKNSRLAMINSRRGE